jgi:hypothetical protein
MKLFAFNKKKLSSGLFNDIKNWKASANSFSPVFQANHGWIRLPREDIEGLKHSPRRTQGKRWEWDGAETIDLAVFFHCQSLRVKRPWLCPSHIRQSSTDTIVPRCQRGLVLIMLVSEMIFKMKHIIHNLIKHNAQHFYHEPHLIKLVP